VLVGTGEFGGTITVPPIVHGVLATYRGRNAGIKVFLLLFLQKKKSLDNLQIVSVKEGKIKLSFSTPPSRVVKNFVLF
jgi:hypothetical protein